MKPFTLFAFIAYLVISDIWLDDIITYFLLFIYAYFDYILSLLHSIFMQVRGLYRPALHFHYFITTQICIEH